MPRIDTAWRTVAAFYERHFFALTDPRNLAIDRIVLCSFTLYYFYIAP
jgi:hypothetical protein